MVNIIYRFLWSSRSLTLLVSSIVLLAWGAHRGIKTSYQARNMARFVPQGCDASYEHSTLMDERHDQRGHLIFER